MSNVTFKVTPENVNLGREITSLGGSELAAQAAKSRTTVTTLTKAAGDDFGKLVLRLAKVANPARREILRREINRANGFGVGKKQTQSAPVVAKSARGKRQVAQVVSAPKDTSEASNAAMAAYPGHPRAAARKAARAVHLGFSNEDAVILAGLFIWNHDEQGEWAKDSVFVTLCNEFSNTKVSA